jgi:hypothetical protein
MVDKCLLSSNRCDYTFIIGDIINYEIVLSVWFRVRLSPLSFLDSTVYVLLLILHDSSLEQIPRFGRVTAN